MLTLFLPLFMILLLLGFPIVFGLIAAPGILLWLNGQERDIVLLYRNVYNGMDSFPLMAIPFFMLAGELMNRAGITMRLVEFAQAVIGHLRGGLAHVNILSSMLFAGLSGSAVADVSALGSMLIPAMEKQGYSRKFATAVTAASSIIGPIIPPSGIMIIYAYVMGESVAALFLAGIVPGVLIGLSLMAIVYLLADRENLPAATTRATWSERGRASLNAFWPLMTPVIIMGGILGGIFTPTEASAVAVGYAIFIGLFVLRSLKLGDMPRILMRAAMTSAVVLLLVGAAMAFKTVASLSHTPELLASIILSLSENPLVLLLLINLLLFVVGMFLDAGPAIIILGPILGPIFTQMGVDSVHFAIIMAVNLTVGLLTPPMGLVLFVSSSVSGLKVETIAKATLPFLAAEIVVIFLITYFPALTLTLPRLAGFVD
ncbi:MAG: TRAP transporter large permease [Alphaproteobacteria bacterium]|jgi:tripartite ATP-independent transporter DctM subunit|uniref:TRAP transporter large permease n=1 Tax=Rhizobium/Agrobacterium group TaxID=227290 RepID=UPI0006B97A56|nr:MULTISPECIES: TRAP transporter large permease [Rhizobium/Agrobacterium group]MBU0738291.1 TRAP transporter large permease [Alphaproteobacteria bacterium]MDM7980969.1 TRAP transporter large permease [Rhizobium sp.]AOG09032.1 TRAP transporter, DctM subunit [Agrobacterium sp. RAC06]KPF61190.1 C4-dicarboxylate ABC transporter permease [Rhizobium sp. AAP116]MBU1764247.1 TRAP transporter large permease [Alphaproteobacteria bacterium]